MGSVRFQKVLGLISRETFGKCYLMWFLDCGKVTSVRIVGTSLYPLWSRGLTSLWPGDGDEVSLGLGRIVAACHRSSTLYQIR